MGEYEYITKGICDVPADCPEIPFKPGQDDMAEKIAEASKTGGKLVITTDRIAHFWNFFRRNLDKQYLVLYGGSGGGKSHSVDQYLTEKLFTEKNCKIAMYRKSGSSLKASIMDMVLEILSVEGYREDVDYVFNRTNRVITALNTGSSMHFKSLDNPEKIKSTKFNYVNMEELTEFTLQDFLMCQNTLRKESDVGAVNQMFITFNPTATSWCWKYFTQMVNDPNEISKYAFNHSTYKNNPHLPKSYVQKLENSYKVDFDFFCTYALGRPGKSKNNIYNNWIEIGRQDYNEYVDKIYGVDFGFNNPTAIVEMYQDRENRSDIYVREILYRTKMTTGDIIDFLNESCPHIRKRGYPLICDSAEPDRIHELKMAGYVAIEADKSVRAGINKTMQYKLNVTSDSENLIRELKSYQWAVDRDGNNLEVPRKLDDHLVDALRYGVMFDEVQIPNEDIEDYITEDDVFYL